jgi:hypothetical protein
MRANDARVRVLERRVGEAELVGLIATQIVEYGVGGGDQPLEGLLTLRGLQVEADAAFVEIEGLEKVRVVFAEEEGTHASCGITTLSAVLDFDDFRSEIGEVHRAEGTCAERFEGQDAQARKRKRRSCRFHGRTQTGFLSINWRAMMIRCISLVPSPIHMSGASR